LAEKEKNFKAIEASYHIAKAAELESTRKRELEEREIIHL